MGKQSTRKNKTIYQICREEAGLTRSEACDKMEAVSDSRLEKFEYELQDPTPYDIIQMADAYTKDQISAIIIVLTNVKSVIVMFRK